MTADEYTAHAFRIQRMYGKSLFGIAAMLKLQAASGERSWFADTMHKDAHRSWLITRAQLGHHDFVRALP